ncbi:hypothetical protein SRHO_G00128140 [Serrasalmus rhombeus]
MRGERLLFLSGHQQLLPQQEIRRRWTPFFPFLKCPPQWTALAKMVAGFEHLTDLDSCALGGPGNLSILELSFLGAKVEQWLESRCVYSGLLAGSCSGSSTVDKAAECWGRAGAPRVTPATL